MKCPKCSKKMIKQGTGIVLTSNPPVYPQEWWCGCGYRESAESIRGKTEDEISREKWEQENGLTK
jgi:C4-type Zn-finger protein